MRIQLKALLVVFSAAAAFGALLWAIPLSLSFGYSSGGGCGDDGWGVGGTWGGWR